MAIISLKQARTVLAATSDRVMLLRDFCEAAGITPTPENLHAVKDVIAAIQDTAQDVFDLGATDVPVLVSYRNRASHGLDKLFGSKKREEEGVTDPMRVVMPDDPRVRARKSADERKSAPQVNLMPFVRLVSQEQYNQYCAGDAVKESLRTGVLKTLAELPPEHRVRFGDVQAVKSAPQDGWCQVTMLVKLS